MSIQSCCNNNKIHVGLLLLYSFKNVNNCHYQLSEEKLKQWAAQKANKINITCFTLTLLLKFISFCCQEYVTCFLIVNNPKNHLQPIRAKVCLVRYFPSTLPGYFTKPTDFSNTVKETDVFQLKNGPVSTAGELTNSQLVLQILTPLSRVVLNDQSLHPKGLGHLMTNGGTL